MANSSVEALLANSWRLSPARMANYLSQGKFVRFPYIELISQAVVRAVGQGNERLIVSLPPRHGKSWLISKWTPAWFLSLYPEQNVILTSYEANFAATWGRQVRNVLQEHGQVLGVRLADDSLASDRWNTREGGGMVTAGIGGPITGRGGQLLICDDVVKNWQEAMSESTQQHHIDWFNSTLYTRCEPGASIVVLGTRWSERDLLGYLLNEHQDQWTEIRLPALAEENDLLGRKEGEPLCPERFDADALEKIRTAVGSRVWNGLYQQRPSSESGSIFKRDWFHYYRELPEYLDQVCISCDMAFKGTENSDYVVMQVLGRLDANFYLIDQVRKRMEFTETVAALRSLHERYPEATAIYIENKANGSAVIDSLTETIPGIIGVEPEGSKEARAQVVSPFVEAGNVYLPDPTLNPWVNEFVDELASFPRARFDDCVDAFSQGIWKLHNVVVDWDFEAARVPNLLSTLGGYW